MTAIECLIHPEKHAQDIQAVISRTQDELRHIRIEPEIELSLLGVLDYVKIHSIRRGGKLLTEMLFKESSETFNGYMPSDFFSKAIRP